MTSAKGTFDIDAWSDDEPYDEVADTRLQRVNVVKRFHGDLVGGSTTDLITVHTASGPVAYVGIERVKGILHGREGSFILRHHAENVEGAPWLEWAIVPTSGTEELAGIRGKGTITIAEDGTHHWTLDYEL
jgi:uncharacterized protein DUF3224